MNARKPADNKKVELLVQQLWVFPHVDSLGQNGSKHASTERCAGLGLVSMERPSISMWDSVLESELGYGGCPAGCRMGSRVSEVD